MFKLFFDNLELICNLLIILGASVLADILSGLQLHIKEAGIKFCWKKLGNDIFRALMIAITLVLLTIVVSFLPSILEKTNITMVGDDAINSVSIIIIAVILVSAIIKYFTDALSKVKTILNLKQDNLIQLRYNNNNNTPPDNIINDLGVTHEIEGIFEQEATIFEEVS